MRLWLAQVDRRRASSSHQVCTVRQQRADSCLENVMCVRGQPDFDFTVCLGGDGTLLHYGSLYTSEVEAIPPVITLGLGTLGFMSSMGTLLCCVLPAFAQAAKYSLRVRLRQNLISVDCPLGACGRPPRLGELDSACTRCRWTG